jgi:hypothetical protein
MHVHHQTVIINEKDKGHLIDFQKFAVKARKNALQIQHSMCSCSPTFALSIRFDSHICICTYVYLSFVHVCIFL